jgi:hypothetical protein
MMQSCASMRRLSEGKEDGWMEQGLEAREACCSCTAGAERPGLLCGTRMTTGLETTGRTLCQTEGVWWVWWVEKSRRDCDGGRGCPTADSLLFSQLNGPLCVILVAPPRVNAVVCFWQLARYPSQPLTTLSDLQSTQRQGTWLAGVACSRVKD